MMAPWEHIALWTLIVYKVFDFILLAFLGPCIRSTNERIKK
jgi:hypothetical protein